MKKYLKGVAGQVSTTDFIISLSIIVIAFVLAFNIYLSTKNSSDYEDLLEVSASASQMLMSEGVPSNWTEDDVVKIGLLSDNGLNISKLISFSNIAYDSARFKLAERNQFYIYFQNSTSIVNLSGCGIGSPLVSVDGNCVPSFSSMKNVVKLNRLVSFNNSILNMVVVLWD